MSSSFHSHPMSDPGTGADAAPGAPNFAARTAEMLLRSALLRSARNDATVQDRTDCAELAIAAGAPDVARMLYNLVFLHMGFAPDAVEAQRAIVHQSGLWTDEVPPTEAATAFPDFSVDRAVAELAHLVRRTGHLHLPDTIGATFTAARRSRGMNILPTLPSAIESELPGICAALAMALRQPFDQSGEGLAALLSELETRILNGPMLDPKEHVSAPLEQLAAVAAYHDLQTFLRSNYTTAYAPTGSPRLLHASARLSRGGIGPYFTNVRNIIRTSRDIFALISLATGDTGGSKALELWTVLLSVHLDGGHLLDLIDELADVGIMTSLWGILEARARRASIWHDYGLLQRLRDAALDRLDWALAINAQDMIVQVAQHDPGELRVLADIVASAGDLARAEALLQEYHRLAPQDQAVVARLEEIKVGIYEEFAIPGGLCTPRYRTRLRRGQPAEAAAA
ncbi:tetratricopeptide repeat protein [Sphingomonas crusticola]|uniref:tetratricopeptide repeat protein n=1 Tax=Sphingomonas crusticola TaxID=1697973 RepID=UPI0013C30322|nr:tetratricopeptide repeat protein [Sphingomonas crusticola]